MGEANDAVADTAQRAFAEGAWDTVVDTLAALPDDADAGHLLLLRAEARRRRGDPPVEVRADILHAVRRAIGDPTRLVRASRMLRHLGDTVGALTVVEAAVAAAPEAEGPRLAHAEILGHLGREREAVLTLEDGLDPAHAPQRALEAARRRLDRADGAGAATLAAAVATLDGPHRAAARDLACDALVAAGQPERARDYLDDSGPPLDRLRRHLDTGDLDGARAVIAVLPPPARAAWTARLALWAGDLDGAADHARRAGDVPLAHLVLAAVDVMRDAPDRAALDHAVSVQDPSMGLLADRAAAHAWRGEAARRLGAGDRARQDGHLALDAEGAYLLPAHLVILLADDPTRPSPVAPADPQAAVDATPLPAATYWSGPGFDAHDPALALAGLLGANRSRWPTVRDATGRLVRVRAPFVPLHAMRPLQASLYVRDVDAVRAEVADLRARFPDDPTMMTYGAEIDLWLGRYAEGLAAAEEALRRCHTQKWAWVGLGASRMFCGDLEGALAAYAEGADVTGGDGPSAYVYRGEALWRLGRAREALPDLSEACRRKPTRVGGWVLWARAHLDVGRTDPSAKVLGHLRATCPGLWVDLLALTGPTQDPGTLLDGVLSLMRGNRSSALPTYVADGTVRGITWTPPVRRSPPGSPPPATAA